MSSHGGSIDGERLPELFRRPDSAAGRQNVAKVIGKPLVNPEKLAMDWIEVRWVVQAHWRPILAVPGMYVFVRYEVAGGDKNACVAQPAVGEAILAGLEVFQRVVVDLIPQR